MKKFRWLAILLSAIMLIPATLFGCGEKGSKEFVPVLRFAVFSDLHFGSKYNVPEKFQKAMKRIYELADADEKYSGLDAVVTCGDNVESATPSFYKQFEDSIKDNVRSETAIITTPGNHEYLATNYTSSTPMLSYDEAKKIWEENLEYDFYMTDIIKGFHFITYPTVVEGGAADWGRNSEWLEDEILDAYFDGREKPIFVFQHYSLPETVSGGSGSDNTLYPIKEMMTEYPQIVDFSGHSHYPLNYPNFIWQDEFTAVTCGSFNTPEGAIWDDGGEVDITQALIVEVSETNEVRINAYDFKGDKFIYEQPFSIENPSKGEFKYKTQDRKADAVLPAFPGNADITVDKVTDSSFSVAFDSASGVAFPRYRIDIKRKDTGALIRTAYRTSGGYRQSPPTRQSVNFTNMVAGSDYLVEVRAEDVFGNLSAPLTKEATTTGTFDWTAGIDFDGLSALNSNIVAVSRQGGYDYVTATLSALGGGKGLKLDRADGGGYKAFIYNLRSPKMASLLCYGKEGNHWFSTYIKNETGKEFAFKISLNDSSGYSLESKNGYVLTDKDGKRVNANMTITSVPTLGSWADGRYVMIPNGFEGRIWFSLNDDKTQQGVWNVTNVVTVTTAVNVVFDIRGVSSDNMGAIWLDDWTLSADIK